MMFSHCSIPILSQRAITKNILSLLKIIKHQMISMCAVDVMNSCIPCGCWYAHRDVWALPVVQFSLILFCNGIFPGLEAEQDGV